MTAHSLIEVRPAPISMEQFWTVAACGDRADIRELTSAITKQGDRRLTLPAQAMDAVRHGDIKNAAQMLQRAIRQVSIAESEYLYDLLIPILVNQRDLHAARSCLSSYRGRVAKLVPAFTAMRAWFAASCGETAESRRLTARALSEEQNIEDIVVRVRFHQRLAVAADRRRDFDEAFEQATESLRWAECSRSAPDLDRGSIAARDRARLVSRCGTGDVLHREKPQECCDCRRRYARKFCYNRGTLHCGGSGRCAFGREAAERS